MKNYDAMIMTNEASQEARQRKIAEVPYAIQTHHLKLNTEYWGAVKAGKKVFEIRKNDRGFQTGDIVVLHKFSTKTKREVEGYNGYHESNEYHYMNDNKFVKDENESETIVGLITYMLPLSVMGLDTDMVVFNFIKLD